MYNDNFLQMLKGAEKQFLKENTKIWVDFYNTKEIEVSKEGVRIEDDFATHQELRELFHIQFAWDKQDYDEEVELMLADGEVNNRYNKRIVELLSVQICANTFRSSLMAKMEELFDTISHKRELVDYFKYMPLEVKEISSIPSPQWQETLTEREIDYVNYFHSSDHI